MYVAHRTEIRCLPLPRSVLSPLELPQAPAQASLPSRSCGMLSCHVLSQMYGLQSLGCCADCVASTRTCTTGSLPSPKKSAEVRFRAGCPSTVTLKVAPSLRQAAGSEAGVHASVIAP